MASMKVKVPVSELLGRVEKAKAEAVAQHERAMSKYQAEAASYPERLASFLEAEAAKARAGKKVDVYNWRYGGGSAALPSTPRKPSLDTSRYDRDLALLEMASDEVLSISTDSDFAKYL